MIAVVVVAGAVLVILMGLGGGGDGGGSGGSADDGATVSLDPELVAAGAELYAGTCASCHGADLQGTDSGPSFLEVTYAANHHDDGAFQRAAAMGVEPHHWDFGPMPIQTSVDEEDVTAIVAYVRQAQQEAGITNDPRHPPAQ